MANFTAAFTFVAQKGPSENNDFLLSSCFDRCLVTHFAKFSSTFFEYRMFALDLFKSNVAHVLFARKINVLQIILAPYDTVNSVAVWK